MVWLLPSLQGNCNDFLGAAGPDRWDVSLLGYLHLSRVMGTFVAAVYPVCPSPSRAHARRSPPPHKLGPRAGPDDPLCARRDWRVARGRRTVRNDGGRDADKAARLRRRGRRLLLDLARRGGDAAAAARLGPALDDSAAGGRGLLLRLPPLHRRAHVAPALARADAGDARLHLGATRPPRERPAPLQLSSPSPAQVAGLAGGSTLALLAAGGFQGKPFQGVSHATGDSPAG